MHDRTYRPGPRSTVLALVAILVLAGAAMAVSATRTSATFDEVVLVSAGARGLETGSWSLLVDQPPLMAVLYALPLRLSGVGYPAGSGAPLGYDDRWDYARDFYFRANDPERTARLSRSVGVVLAGLIVLLAWGYATWAEGRGAGLLTALLVAFLPDVLAHGAVAYNDLPLAVTFLGAVWALDAAVRTPGPARGALAGGLVAVSLGTKFSAVALGPVALVLALLAAAGATRLRDVPWRGWLAAAGAAGLAAWAVLALTYRGDPLLLELERGLRMTVRHAAEGHPAPAYLFGRTSPTGWWSFFPVAFFVKTPAALHLLLPIGVAGLLAGRAGRGPSGGSGGGSPGRGAGLSGRAKAAARSPLRGPAVALFVFGTFLVTSDLNVGFRYALPALPPLLILVAVGVVRMLRRFGSRRRLAVGLLLVLYVGSTLSVAPWFLAYRSEWVRARPAGQEPLLDSSLDWGQGLLELRDFMREEGVDRVRLSYFGSALPAGYGIRYEALPSFLRLPPDPAGPGAPGAVAWTAISVNNLHGLYFPGADPFAAWRSRTPDRILAGSIYLYRDGAGDG